MPHHTAPAAALRSEGGGGNAFDVAALGQADQYRFILDQVRFAELFGGIPGDSCAAIVPEPFGEVAHIVLDQGQDLLRMGQQVFQMSDVLCHLLMLFFDLPALEGGQPAQLHIQNGLGLDLAQIEAADQVLLGHIGILRFTDRLDDGVKIIERDQVAVEDVLAGAGLGKLEVRTADDHHLAVLDEDLQ